MDITALVGIVAAFCILVSQIPQVYRSLKLKETRDLSEGMILLLITGSSLWLVYGILRADIIIVVSNIIMIGIELTLLVIKLRYK